MSATKPADDFDLYAAARDWLIDCYPEEEEEIRAASDQKIFKVVSRDYCGGWTQFALDAVPVFIPR
jgi:hypothetical protein